MDEYIETNRRGILYGPEESLQDFQKRKHNLEILSSQFSSFAHKDLVGVENKILIYEELDLEINWFLVKRESKGLYFWEGAATWEIELEGNRASFVQYKKIKNVSVEELFKHEAIHCVRQVFNEPIYEEFLAYATSKSLWRRFFGPLFRSSIESLAFVVISLGCSLGFLFESTSSWSFYVWIFMCLFFQLRLFVDHLIFNRALAKIRQAFQEKNPLKIAIRLTDKEIRFFCFSKLAKITSFINNKRCFRWKQIVSSYLIKSG